jgi:hypothetical protein
MVKALYGWEFNDIAGFRYVHWTAIRRVAVKRLASMPRMVVIQI